MNEPNNEIKVLFEQPPIISEARIAFRLPDTMIFAYAPYIYNPGRHRIDEPLYTHESHHIQQQGTNPQAWWQRYLHDVNFRLSQEIPAYQMQYRAAKGFIKDRNKLHLYLVNLASDLSGPIYGDLLRFQDAYDAIKREELYNFGQNMV